MTIPPKIIRSRKEKPPKTALKVMKLGTGGDYMSAAIIISLCLLTLMMTIIGLLNSINPP